MNLLIVTGIFPPDHGGPASYVPEIAGWLAQSHALIAVITLSDRAEDAEDVGRPYPVVRIRRGQNRFARMISTILRIRRYSAGADVVYLNGLVLEGIVACRILRRKPVVIKVVGDLIWEKARTAGATSASIEEFGSKVQNWRWELLKKLQHWYTRRADAVIVPSAYLGGIVKSWSIPAENIRIVYNAVLQRASESASEQRFDLVTVARLMPWKGLRELVELAAEERWSLKIVGEGPMRSELSAQIESAGAPAIRLAGAVPKASVQQEIAEGTVFVLNSSYEGLPHVVLEARAAGVPVIATAVGGTPEVIGDGEDGILVRPGEKEMLRRAIRSLLSDPALRRRLVGKAFEDLRARFSFETMARKTSDVLSKAAGR